MTNEEEKKIKKPDEKKATELPDAAPECRIITDGDGNEIQVCCIEWKPAKKSTTQSTEDEQSDK